MSAWKENRLCLSVIRIQKESNLQQSINKTAKFIKLSPAAVEFWVNWVFTFVNLYYIPEEIILLLHLKTFILTVGVFIQ